MSLLETSASRPQGQSRNAYWVLAGVATTTLLATLLFSTFPIKVGAFWPFLYTQAADDSETPLIHDNTIALLEAATNSDPNPSKGGPDIATTGDAALIASIGPDGTIPTASSVSGSGSISLYVVREGDSLSQIADMFGVSNNTILWANDIKDAKLIRPGDTLLILPVSGTRHTVAKGETLAGVAKKYGADADEIALFNGLDAGAALAQGSELIIPGGEQAPAKAAPKKTSTASGLAKSTGSMTVAAGYFLNPVPGALLTQGVHGTNGVDIGAKSGTPIQAAADGTVLVSKPSGWNGGYGSYVVLSHANGTQSLYAHMSSDIVSVGQSVSAGEVIGYVGNTGIATGFHLHFEVRGAKNPFAGCSVMKVCTFK